LSEKKKILYVVTSGVDTPERTYAPFILATTAVTMGIEATIYFLIKGVTIVKQGEAEKIKMGDLTYFTKDFIFKKLFGTWSVRVW
jgi:predicted peroxiredoxin